MNSPRATIASLLAISCATVIFFDSFSLWAAAPVRRAPSFVRDEIDPLTVFKNTKEDRSFIVPAAGVTRDKKSLVSPEIATRIRAKYDAVPAMDVESAARNWMGKLKERRGICEPRALSLLQDALATTNLTASNAEVVDFLLYLRMTDRLDDVILYPLWKSAPTWISLGFPLERALPEVDERRPREDISAESASPDSESEEAQLRLIFRGLDETCPTRAWNEFVRREKKLEGKWFSEETLAPQIQKAIELGLISPHLSSWFYGLHRDRPDEVPYELSVVLDEYPDAKDVRLAREAPRLAKTPFLTQKVKGKPHSQRVALYGKFDAAQMKSLAKLLEDHSLMWTAHSARKDFLDENGKVKISRPMRPAQIYDEAREELQEMVRELIIAHDSKLSFTYEDIVLASIETGFLDGTMVEASLKIDGLQDPKVRSAEKIKKWVRRVLGPAVILIPPPYNIIASVGMVLAEAFLLKPAKEEIDPIVPGSRK